ncbi:MAG: hypothetical protein ABIB71_08350 [Candidatus Woesearchaeota archaeon]
MMKKMLKGLARERLGLCKLFSSEPKSRRNKMETNSRWAIRGVAYPAGILCFGTIGLLGVCLIDLVTLGSGEKK